MSDWHKITCDERNAIYAGRPWLTVSATLTDLLGEFGEPQIFTEWAVGDAPVLRDRRWPDRDGERPDARPCEHYTTLPTPEEKK